MKRTGSPTVKIAAATSMVVFSLGAAFAGSMAWFNAVTAQGTGANGFSAYAGSNIDILSCYAVRYDGSHGAVAVDVSGGNQKIAMSEYDYIFTDRNVNTPLFLRMEIAGFDTTKNLSVSIPCSGSYKNESNQVEPYLSNVVCAKFLYGLKQGNNLVVDDSSWSGGTVTTQSVVDSYKGMVANAAQTTGTPYVVDSTKTKSLTITLNANDVFDTDFIVTRTNSKGEQVDAVVVYVGLDYYVTNNTNLVTSYIASYQGATHSLLFNEDIQSISLSHEGGAS